MNNKECCPKECCPKSIQEAINKNENFIVTKEGCPFCKRACELLKKHNIKYEIYDHKDADCLDKELCEKHCECKTYPKIYLEGKWIGGCSELEECLKKREH